MSAKNKTVEQKITQLRRLVDWFDSDDFIVEEAADRYKEAAELASEIKKELDKLKNDIHIVARAEEL